MFRELVESRLVRTFGRAARTLNYPRETAALEARHRRLGVAWASHVCATQNALLAAAVEAEDDNGAALIIGAGVAQDLSLSDLASCFREVWLVDAVFSRQTLNRIKPWRGRIRCVVADVTGLIETVWRHREVPASADIPRRLPFAPPANLRWIASVNCLTQLPLPLARWLLKRHAPDGEVERFGRDLMTAHIEQLDACGVPVCLITELEDRRLGRRGQVLDTTDFRPLLVPPLQAVGAELASEWDWWVHPPGELPGGESELRHIAAWRWRPHPAPEGGDCLFGDGP
jgi:hypothetical protein